MKILRAVLIISIMLVCSPVLAEMSYDEAESKAKEAHDLAASDVTYQQADTRALYFQNVQIIELLKEVREELRSLNSKSK